VYKPPQIRVSFPSRPHRRRCCSLNRDIASVVEDLDSNIDYMDVSSLSQEEMDHRGNIVATIVDASWRSGDCLNWCDSGGLAGILVGCLTGKEAALLLRLVCRRCLFFDFLFEDVPCGPLPTTPSYARELRSSVFIMLLFERRDPWSPSLTTPSYARDRSLRFLSCGGPLATRCW
jgi:hypothetical protein